MVVPAADATPSAGAPILIACAHGTRSPDGQAVVAQLAEAAGERLGVEVREAFVDVQEPQIADVVAGVPVQDGLSAIVVPLLLSAGYHVHHDIANAIKDRPDVLCARALGPDGRLASIVVERLLAANVPGDATVVLAPAGSSDPRATSDAHQAADLMRMAWGGPVRLGFAAASSPSVPEAVVAARDYGETTVAVGSYLLAPGHFQGTLGTAGADYVSAPLAPDDRLAEIVADRYLAAREGRGLAFGAEAGEA